MTKKLMPSLAYLFFRSSARFWGSIFFPLLKIWGETDVPTRGGRFFVARYRGLVTWITVLRVFSRPLAFVISGAVPDPWIKLARAGGLDISILSADPPQAEVELTDLTATKQQFVLLFSEDNAKNAKAIVNSLQKVAQNQLLFLAVHGTDKILPAGAIIPKVNQVVALCALPPATKASEGPTPDQNSDQDAISDLKTLENALAKHDSVSEPPSFFFNHQRNL